MANKNLFNSILLKKPKSNVFDLTHDVKMSMKFGYLTPVLTMECVPGDNFKIGCESLIRFAPLVSPVMHRMDVTVHYFFVPNRLVWENFEEWINDVETLTPPAFPTLTFGGAQIGVGNGDLADYLGLPNTGVGDDVETELSAIPFAAYQLIYNEYYRDQNLVEEVEYALVDGSNMDNQEDLITIRRRAWEHDYFTAALPWAQKGQAVELPILADVTLKDETTLPGQFVKIADHDDFNTGNVTMGGVPPNGGIDIGGAPHVYDPMGSLEVNGATTTINDLRRAEKLQEWLELAARAGSRYTETIRAFFGVQPQDARLQRPEYITGVKSPVVISEVLNTTGETLPQGNMAGHGVSVVSGQYGSYFCQEHGYIIGIMSVLPKTAYQNGIPKHFLKINDRYEWYWPQFAHLGEQEVSKREIFAWQNYDEVVFGYVPRYSEYKYMPSRVAGDFKTTLSFWHLGRQFVDTPALNEDFIECNPRTDVFAVDDNTDYLYCHVLNKIRAVRPMPKFGTPSL